MVWIMLPMQLGHSLGVIRNTKTASWGGEGGGEGRGEGKAKLF